MIISVVLGGSLGFFFAKSKKPMYTATTTFVLEAGGDNVGGALGQYAGMAAMVGIDLGGSGGGIFQGDNLLELYKSRKMIEATLLLKSNTDSSKLLIDQYLEINNVREKWKKENSKLSNIDFAKQIPKDLLRDRDSLLQKAVLDINKNILSVDKLDKKTAIIKVEVTSANEVFSKEFNEALVDEVNDFYVQTKTKKSLDNILILQNKTDSVRAVMNGNITTAAAVFDATPNLNPTKQAQRLIPTQRSQFSAETNKAILGQLVQNLEMSKMALLKEAPLIQKVDEPVYPLMVTKVGLIKGILVFAFIFVFFSIIAIIVIKYCYDIIK
ncbi:lipopolysaccharide biosynthesis protein [Sphingobacterium faecium]|uniref:lipopolysaccharide biosynthesis protein n=1 Tax=Sphingobacterium faecium TaxID=34087 RepID=UPI003208C561